MVTHRFRVVIIGAGFGGLTLARSLRHEPMDIVVVDARNHHTFQPLLYQVATAGLDTDDVCHSIRGVFHRQRNVTVRLGAVTAIDHDQSAVLFDDGTSLEYDRLVLAAGAVTNDFGVPGVAEFAYGLKQVEDALALRRQVLEQFERVSARPELIEAGALTFVIVGGGPTGVELGGGLNELINNVLARDFPNLDVRVARVVVVEAADRLLGPFNPALSATALETLERRGIEVLLSSSVARVNADSVELTDGRTIRTNTVVWAAGVRPHPIAQAFPQADNGRVLVDEFLRVVDRPNCYAIGDIANTLSDGRPLPQVAPVAIQGARYVARHLALLRRSEEIEPFRYQDKGSMATIGRHAAVAELPNGVRLRGITGWIAWLGLHLVMLIGFRNRLNVLVNWAWSYLTYDRASRIIVDVPKSSPHALEDR